MVLIQENGSVSSWLDRAIVFFLITFLLLSATHFFRPAGSGGVLDILGWNDPEVVAETKRLMTLLEEKGFWPVYSEVFKGVAGETLDVTPRYRAGLALLFYSGTELADPTDREAALKLFFEAGRRLNEPTGFVVRIARHLDQKRPEWKTSDIGPRWRQMGQTLGHNAWQRRYRLGESPETLERDFAEFFSVFPEFKDHWRTEAGAAGSTPVGNSGVVTGPSERGNEGADEQGKQHKQVQEDGSNVVFN